MASPERRLPITAIVAVRNEERNIAKCLQALTPAERTIVADSGSADATVAIARDAGAEVVQFEYQGGYPRKRQWVLDTVPITSEWVLLVDADEVIPPALWAEIEASIQSERYAAYAIQKSFHFLGRRFAFGGFSHRAVLLFRRGAARFEDLFEETDSGLDMEVHERLIVDGAVGNCSEPLIHEDFKGLDAYIQRHSRYATWEAALRYGYLKTGRYGKQAVRASLFGNVQERRRWLKLIALKLPFEPIAWFLYHYVARLGFLEGRRGYLAARIRAHYIWEVRAKIYERDLLCETEAALGRR